MAHLCLLSSCSASVPLFRRRRGELARRGISIRYCVSCSSRRLAGAALVRARSAGPTPAGPVRRAQLAIEQRVDLLGIATAGGVAAYGRRPSTASPTSDTPRRFPREPTLDKRPDERANAQVKSLEDFPGNPFLAGQGSNCPGQRRSSPHSHWVSQVGKRLLTRKTRAAVPTPQPNPIVEEGQVPCLTSRSTDVIADTTIRPGPASARPRGAQPRGRRAGFLSISEL